MVRAADALSGLVPRGRPGDERAASWLGLALGGLFAVCFATGLLSDLIQAPPPWFAWFPRPVWLYRVTQGLHVFAGLALVPLTLAKLWVVYPRLFQWPPVRGAVHAAERALTAPLVAGSLLLLVTGVMNIAYWYAWGFPFTDAHYWTAWITVGAILVHVGAKAGVVRRVLRRAPAPTVLDGPGLDGAGLSRRGVIAAAWGAAGLVLLTTIGETVGPLRRLAVLAPRSPTVGPQGFPVNTTAAGAGAERAARDPGWRLVVEGAVATPLALSLADLRALPATSATLPIACVEGWSVERRWTGVALRDLVAAAGGSTDRGVRVESLQPAGPYRTHVLAAAHAADPATLLAYDVEGEPLHLDHGFPLRLIAPNNPGVLQTKWLARVVVA